MFKQVSESWPTSRGNAFARIIALCNKSIKNAVQTHFGLRISETKKSLGKFIFQQVWNHQTYHHITTQRFCWLKVCLDWTAELYKCHGCHSLKTNLWPIKMANVFKLNHEAEKKRRTFFQRIELKPWKRSAKQVSNGKIINWQWMKIAQYNLINVDINECYIQCVQLA